MIPDPRDPAVFAPGQVVSGRYRIERFLGRGGMGEVYEAEDLELREHIALKTLRPEIAGDTRSIARFKQEIQLSRKVAHPNVCKVFDLVRHPVNDTTASVVYFLTMELLAGETLEARLRREGPLRPDHALPLLEQICAALDAAHQAGIVHRDLKPSNIMLVPGPAEPRAVVTDFGLARSNAPPGTHAITQTVTGHVMGTPGYLAPELLAGATATVSSDIYALGVTAGRMIAGTPAAGLDTTKPDLDPKWMRAIRRALDREPSRRFSTAGEFVEAVRGHVAMMALPGRPAMLAAGALVLVAMAAWLGWRRWETWRAQPSPEALHLYRMGTDDLHAAAYFAATKALEQAVRLAPHHSLAHARLAEAWMELDLPEKAGVEMLIARREGTAGLSSLDRLQVDAIDLSITREFAGAAAKYEQMLRGAGTDKAGLYADLGRTFERSEQPGQALENYSRATQAEPRNAAAWLRLAALHSQALQWAQAQDEFHRAEEIYQMESNLEGLTEVAYQRSADANRRERLEENAEYARKALETAYITGNVHQQIRAKLQLGSNAIFAGDGALAEKYAGQALETARSNHIESLAIRGILILSNAYRGKRDFANAEKHCREALDLARAAHSGRLTAMSWLALAGLHDQQGRSEDASREAREALNFFEPHHYARESLLSLALLGRAQRNRGDPAALDLFGRALEMAQQLKDARQMSLAHASMGSLLSQQERLPEALVHFEQSLQLSTSPQQVGYAALECAETLWPLGRYWEAAALFDQAEANAAKFPALRLAIAASRAEMLLSQRRFSETAALCARTLAASPEPGHVLKLKRLLGSAQIGLGRKQEGRRNCEDALAMAGKAGDVSAALNAKVAAAEARLDTGDRKAALALIQQVMPTVAHLPLSHWYMLALAARADPANSREFAADAKRQLDEIERAWGAPAFAQYAARPDLQGLVRTVVRLSANTR